MIKFPLALGLILSLFACSNSSSPEIEKAEAEIASLLIDEMTIAFPIPSPPSKDSLDYVIANTNWDSIRKIPSRTILDTILFATQQEVILPEELDSLQVLVNEISALPPKKINYKHIKSNEGHTIIMGNSLEDDNRRYNQIISLSRIVFNNKKDIAVLFAGHATHPLASYLNFFVLKKTNDKWSIIFEKQIEIS